MFSVIAIIKFPALLLKDSIDCVNNESCWSGRYMLFFENIPLRSSADKHRTPLTRGKEVQHTFEGVKTSEHLLDVGSEVQAAQL